MTTACAGSSLGPGVALPAGPRSTRPQAAQRVAQAARLAAAAAVAAAAADHAGRAGSRRSSHSRARRGRRLRARHRARRRAAISSRLSSRARMAREKPKPRQRRELGASCACPAACWRAAADRGSCVAHARGETEVGDDEGVEAGEVRRFQRRERRPDLLVLEQCVERQVRARVIEVGGLDGRHDGLAGEVAGEGARAPALEAEVDGVGAGRQGRAQRARLTGRRQQLDGA